MKSIKESIHNKINKNRIEMNTVPGSVGAAMLNHSDEISKAKDQKDLDEVLTKIHEDITPEFEEDWNEMMELYDKQKTFVRKYRYIYNFILAGDGLRAE